MVCEEPPKKRMLVGKLEKVHGDSPLIPISTLFKIFLEDTEYHFIDKFSITLYETT